MVLFGGSNSQKFTDSITSSFMLATFKQIYAVGCIYSTDFQKENIMAENFIQCSAMSTCCNLILAKCVVYVWLA